MAISMDLTASIAAIIEGNPQKPFDGIDIVRHIVHGDEDFPRTLFWRKNRGDKVQKAVRDNAMKYISIDDGTEIKEYLFNLEIDPGEKKNLKDIDKDEFSRLKDLMKIWENEVKTERYD